MAPHPLALAGGSIAGVSKRLISSSMCTIRDLFFHLMLYLLSGCSGL